MFSRHKDYAAAAGFAICISRNSDTGADLSSRPIHTELAESDPLPRRVMAGFALAWLAFWLLMILVAVQENLRDPGGDRRRPLVSEGSGAGLVQAKSLDVGPRFASIAL